jgi:hypothetical protein
MVFWIISFLPHLSVHFASEAQRPPDPLQTPQTPYAFSDLFFFSTGRLINPFRVPHYQGDVSLG